MTKQNDPWRLKYHLMPPSGWMNDPNGLCYFKGEYHVFYQYQPDNPNGGLKYWGHYKSKDLITWEECDIFLRPDKEFKKSGVYSGSALVHDDKLYLFYTGNVKEEGNFDYIYSGRQHNTVLALSSDAENIEEEKVLLYNKDYPTNLSLHIRDPKVFKHEDKFYMILGARTLKDKGVGLIFESEDLYTWVHINTLSSDFVDSYMWECPDLFEINGQWILILSPQGIKHEKFKYQNVYSCGYFKLKGDFRSENCSLLDYTEINKGFDFYAPQTFKHENRRFLLAWAGMPDAEYTNPTVDFGWQHALSSMLELKFSKGKLSMLPVKEIDTLFEAYKTISVSQDSAPYIFKTNRQAAFDIRVFDISPDTDFLIEFFDTMKIEFSSVNREFILSSITNSYGRDKRFLSVDSVKNLRILTDTSMLEIFINDGEEVFTTRYYPASYDNINFCGTMSLIINKLKI